MSESSDRTDVTLAAVQPADSGGDPTMDGGTRASGSLGGVSSGDKIGRFEVVSKLGEGGMGVVYLARDPELGRRLAVKLVRVEGHGSAGESDRARLQREAQAMATVSHANLVTVYDVGRHHGEVFIAMEYIDGSTLRDWLRAGPRSAAEILGAFVAAGRGLAAAHAVGIVHRDFKPDNVLVGHDGTVKVLDFGLAAEEPQADDLAMMKTQGREDPLAVRLTRTGAILGTPAYMSPEQHHGRRSDARTDQFSFAVALFEALYDKRPFSGETMAELVHNVLGGHVTSVHRFDVSATVQRALRRALAVDPNDRFPDMRALLAAIEPAQPRRQWPWFGLGLTAVGAVALVALMTKEEPPPEIVARHEPAVPTAPEVDAAGEALAAIPLAPNDSERRHLAQAYLAEHGESGGEARRAIVEATLGDLMWRDACPITVHDLCIQVTDVPKIRAMCLEPTHGPIVGRKRSEAMSAEARVHLEQALALANAELPTHVIERRRFADSIATARIRLLDADLERHLVEPLPTVHDMMKSEWGTALRDHVQRRIRTAEDLERRYREITSSDSAYWSVVALARVGMLWEGLSEPLLAEAVPANLPKRKQVLACDNLHDLVIDEARSKARKAFAQCSRAATEAGLSSDLVELCDTRISALSQLDNDVIRQVIRSHVRDIRDCYDPVIAQDPQARGRIIARFNIGSSGSVMAVGTTDESTMPASMRECIENKVRGWKFPAPAGGGEMAVTYPFSFEPG